MEQTQRWTLVVEENTETGELILSFPDDLMASAGWQEGDTLKWTDNGDGSWSLSRDMNTESK